MPDFDRLHKLAHRLAQLTAPGQQNPGLSSWCMFVGEDWTALAEMWSPIIAPEPVPARPPSSGVSDANLIAALEQIARWDGFPHTGTFWKSGNEMSYGAAFGSNGERDYMRKVAENALAKARGEKPNAE